MSDILDWCRALDSVIAPIDRERKECPKCGASPIRKFLYGQVMRHPYTWKTLWLPIGKPRPSIAVICWDCKEIIGYD